VDSATGLPIYSLYGRTSAPTEEMLAGIDVLLVDLQDAGARYYTYITTTVDVMTAAAGKGIPVVVLDRPDPIGGAVQGNVLEAGHISAVGRLRVPMRHGLTLGEMARLARADLGIGGALVVVPVAGWSRTMAFDQTGLPFVPPSPNLRTLESLYHYPGTCLFEGTNLSVGRGTPQAFAQVGSPWLNATALAAVMNARKLPGVRFEAVTFTPEKPSDGKYPSTKLNGVRWIATDRKAYDPAAAAVHMLVEIKRMQGDSLRFIPASIDRLIGDKQAREKILAGASAADVMAGWKAQRDQFLAARSKYLLY
jgi:uncharacterized protein YbbC (DUF1343 family)